MPTTGRCNCSGITVTLEQLPPNSVLCYWRSGGAPCSIIYMLDRSTVTVDDSQNLLKTYVDKDSKSGNPVHRSFCNNCGSPVYSSMGPEAPKIFLKGGLFDELQEPNFENMPESKPGWVSVKGSL